MDENEKNEVATEQPIGVDYISQIEQMKKNSVPKAEYDKLKSEQERMLKILQEGGQLPSQEPEIIMPPVDELRKDLFTEDCDLTNLDFWTKTLQLREQILRNENRDIFVAKTPRLNPTQFDYDCANKVARVVGECIEYADGDPEAFTNELMRRTNDVSIPFNKGR